MLVQTGRARLPGDTTSPLKFQNEGTIGVGVDGSLVEHYPGYQDKMRHSLRLVVGEEIEKKVDIGLAKDGSGVGGELTRSFTTVQVLNSGLFSCSLCSTSLEEVRWVDATYIPWRGHVELFYVYICQKLKTANVSISVKYDCY